MNAAAKKALAEMQSAAVDETESKLALERLQNAAMLVADILDRGERDPRWVESQELEEAAISYGRLLLKERS